MDLIKYFFKKIQIANHNTSGCSVSHEGNANQRHNEMVPQVH